MYCVVVYILFNFSQKAKHRRTFWYNFEKGSLKGSFKKILDIYSWSVALEHLQFLPKHICPTPPPSVNQWHMYQSPTYLWVFAFISTWKHSSRFSMSDRANLSDSPLLLNKKKSDDEVVSSTPNLMYLTMWHLNLQMCEHLRQDMRTVYSNVRFIRQCGLTNLCSVVSGWFVALVSFSSHCSILSGKLENTSRLTFKIAMNDLLERARASSIVACDSVVADCISVIATIQWIKSNDLKYWVLVQRFDNPNR